MNNDILVRYGQPTKYDHSAYGTICKVMSGADGKDHIYIQLSQNEAEPNWHFIGAFDIDTDDVILKHVEDFLNK